MADAAITFLLENLKNLLVEQNNLSSGAKERKQLQDELELMNALLLEYRDREKGPVLKQIERQIRVAVFEAEDTLDSCLSQQANSSSRYILDLNLEYLDKKVKELRLDLQPIFDRAIKGLTALPIDSVPASTPPTSSYHTLTKTELALREDNIVGFADEKATLIKYLYEKTEQLDVISIVGMPGLGKTTLAWKIYRDPKIQIEFPTLIWVYVSQELNVREVFLTILKKFTREDMSGKEEWELGRLVRSHLDRGRFLLIMDDVWTVRAWKLIEHALPRKNKLGKVLITSRNESVAKQTNLNRKPHKLRFLHTEESWELLQWEVFGNSNACPGDLEGVGKHIATQCGGVPLAVVVIGQTLIEKGLDRREWEKVSDINVNNHDETSTESISLSYEKLPPDLRDCFLYLGMFPVDIEIPVWNLIRLWIAEGFIQPKRGRSLEKVAEDNLNDLVARNLVMADKTKANGDIKTCRVHDMIREFCQNQATHENKNLFQQVKKTRTGVFEPPISEIVNYRHLCIHSNVMEFLCKKPKATSVRSFLCYSKEMINMSSQSSSFPRLFNLLRVLDITPLKFTEFPPKLSNLIHLRYIALSVDQFKALPESVSKLWNLQTLKIDTTLSKLEIEMDISKMKKLRHLKTKASICLDGEGGKELQTLSRLSAKSCKEELFSTASCLKYLGIQGNINTLLEVRCLEKLVSLEKLKLVADKALHRVPHLHSFPPNLRMLTLTSTHLPWTQMSVLGGLHRLEVLKLNEMAFRGKLWEAQGGGFPSLETLHISRTDLEIWTAATNEPFPRLKNLILKNCERLEEIPSALGKGKWLHLLEIEGGSRALVQSAKKIDFEKRQLQDGQVRTTRGGFMLRIAPGDIY